MPLVVALAQMSTSHISKLTCLSTGSSHATQSHAPLLRPVLPFTRLQTYHLHLVVFAAATY